MAKIGNSRSNQLSRYSVYAYITISVTIYCECIQYFLYIYIYITIAFYSNFLACAFLI